MSLVDHLMKREKLDLAQSLAKEAKQNAMLKNEILRQEIEIFWLKVALNLPNVQDDIKDVK